MRIHLPAETWAEVFAWLNNNCRQFFVRETEQLWDREFSPIICEWLHVWTKNIKIDAVLKFDKKEGGANQAELWRFARDGFWAKQRVPIAEVQMPRNICSFEEVQIRYLDITVLAFLRRMRPLLLRNNVHLSIDGFHEEDTAIATALDHLLPLFSGGSEFESVRLSYNDISLLHNSRYSLKLLDTKLLKIEHDCSIDWLHELLANWLFSKRADGQPRMLVLPGLGAIGCRVFIEIIQERFMAAIATDKACPSFIVRSSADKRFYSLFVEKTIRNTKNGQQLIARKINIRSRGWWYSEEKHYILLISCPLLGVTPMHLAEWEQKVFGEDSSLGVKRTFQLMSPRLGPLDSIVVDNPQQQQQSGSIANKELKRNVQQNEDEEKENPVDKKRARLI